MGPLWRMPETPVALCFTVSTGFHLQKLWGLLSLGWGAWCGIVDSCSSGTSIAAISFQVFNHHTRVWHQPILCLSLSTNLDMASSEYPYRTYVQLDAKWFLVMVILLFSYTFDVVWEEVSTSFTFSTILTMHLSS